MTAPPNDNHAGTKQRRPLWMKFLIGLVMVLVCIGVFILVLDVVGRSALERQLEAIRAAGDPLTLEEFEASLSPIPDKENGALVLDVLFADPRFAAAEKCSNKANPILGSATLPDFGEPFDAAVVEAVREYARDNAEVLAELDRIRDYPRGRFKLDLPWDINNQPMELLRDVRVSVKARWLAVLDAAFDGRIADAVQGIPVMLNISATLEDQGTVLSMLVYTASRTVAVQAMEDALELGECEADVLVAVAKDLERHENSQALLNSAMFERAWQMEFFAALRGEGTSPGVVTMPIPSSFPRTFRGWNRLDEAKALSLMNLLVEGAKDIDGHSNLADELAQKEATISRLYMVTKMISPSMGRSSVAWRKSVAMLRCARAGLAVERYRMAHLRWPDSLAELVPDYLDAVPIDPFDGKPLRYAIAGRWVAVYSVNENKVDDGGKFATHDQRQILDIGFRLLNSDLRKLRTLEPKPDTEDIED